MTPGRPPETIDRLMVGACGAVWLVFLVVAVIAGVALVNLGNGGGGSGRQSSWLLYTVIAVSALTIAAAIPLLLRARRDAAARPESGGPPATVVPAPEPNPEPVIDAPTEKIRVFGTSVDPSAGRPTPSAPASHGAVQRAALRGTVALFTVMGLASTAVATATYLLAVDSAAVAYAALGLAGLFTAALPALAVMFGRRLVAAGA